MANKSTCAIIGCGGMARHHLRQMLKQQESTEVAVICEPSDRMYQMAVEIFQEAGVDVPPNEPNLAKLLQVYGPSLDTAFIISPHAFHHDQAVSCLEAGLDVLLEKPMVMNAAEAESLIRKRDETGRLLVVAFPGSLSPQIRTAVSMLRSGEMGKLNSISATVWQGWGQGTANSWRQEPKISGGGFLFDTGAHMLNTVVDLAGEDFTEVAAWLDNNQRPVEIFGVVIGKLSSGAMVTLHGCGDTIQTCKSDVRVFCSEGIIITGVWGEKLELQRNGEEGFSNFPVPESLGVWEQFLAVREKKIDNPCPPEVGLRMARLYDAIKESAARHGNPVQV